MHPLLPEALHLIASARSLSDLEQMLVRAAGVLGLTTASARAAAGPDALPLLTLSGEVAGWIGGGDGAAELAAAWAVAHAYCQVLDASRSRRVRPVWDPATGLWTAEGLRERLRAEIARASRRGADLAVMAVSAADESRLRLALQRRLRVSDYLGLIDQRFVILLPESDRDAARALFDHIARSLDAPVAAGAAVFHGSETADELIEDALIAHDRALASDAGRLVIAGEDAPRTPAPAAAQAAVPDGVLPERHFLERAQRLFQLALLRSSPLTVLVRPGVAAPPSIPCPAGETVLWGIWRSFTVGLTTLPASRVAPDAERAGWTVAAWGEEETLLDLLESALHA